jgi:hypothetical protein
MLLYTHANQKHKSIPIDPRRISLERAVAWHRKRRALSSPSHPLADDAVNAKHQSAIEPHLTNPVKADATPYSGFLSLPHWKQEALRNVGRGGRSYAELSRELDANGHKYPDITQDDLAIAWEHNRGEPAPAGVKAEEGGLADWLSNQGYTRVPSSIPGEFVWRKLSR